MKQPTFKKSNPLRFQILDYFKILGIAFLLTIIGLILIIKIEDPQHLILWGQAYHEIARCVHAPRQRNSKSDYSGLGRQE